MEESPHLLYLDATTGYKAISAASYTFEELADIYNQTRVDYIVPMPMNAKRLREYVLHYDVDLAASAVITDHSGELLGVGMLGLRDQRAWITRLGVIPNARKKRIGYFIMEVLLSQARQRHTPQVQLEVIHGNEPAYRLFLKYGFNETRELMVIRRPPSKVNEAFAPAIHALTPLTHDEVMTCLLERSDEPSWIEETASLGHVDGLAGFHLQLTSGAMGWLVYQSAAFKLTHLVMDGTDETVYDALLYCLHQQQQPMKDTVVENVAANSPLWASYEKIHYIETFRRVEMRLNLE